MKRISVTTLAALLSISALAAEPPLPGGLAVPDKRSEEPALPGGLGSTPKKPAAEPTLPGGLLQTAQEPALPISRTTSTLNGEFPDEQDSLFSSEGFVEARAGSRLHSDPRQRDTSIAEARFQLSVDYTGETLQARISGDLLADQLNQIDRISLNRGEGAFDLRESWLQTSLADNIDLKAGRQILTWGTGDMLFINDLFPKDWNSFFIGRDSEYLKAPSDAIKTSLYFDALNMDLVWTPEFDSDRFIDGRRVSFFNPMTGALSGRESPVEPQFPGDSEWAVRLYKNVQGVEYALYGYSGYWKSPNGFDPRQAAIIFPELQVLGASARGNLGGGIANLEVGHYNSRDDQRGDNPFINNSEWRLLAGFETELAANLTGAFQYYAEAINDYSTYKQSLLSGQIQRDKVRQLLTTRLTWLTMNQNLTWSLFLYYSPSDRDFYARPKISWKASDQLLVEGGLNLFGGREQHSFFGQFDDASNFYAALRYSF